MLRKRVSRKRPGVRGVRIRGSGITASIEKPGNRAGRSKIRSGDETLAFKRLRTSPSVPFLTKEPRFASVRLRRVPDRGSGPFRRREIWGGRRSQLLAPIATRSPLEGLNRSWIERRSFGRAHEFGQINVRWPFQVTDDRKAKHYHDEKLDHDRGAYSPPVLAAE